MGLAADIEEATGRAGCMICGQKIKKDTKAIWVHGYRTAGFLHSNSWECGPSRFGVRDLIELAARGEAK